MIVEDFKLQYARDREVQSYIQDYQNKTFDAAKFSGKLVKDRNSQKVPNVAVLTAEQLNELKLHGYCCIENKITESKEYLYISNKKHKSVSKKPIKIRKDRTKKEKEEARRYLLTLKRKNQYDSN